MGFLLRCSLFLLFCVIYLRPCRLIAFKRPASRRDRKKKGASREQRAVPMKARQMPTFFLSLSSFLFFFPDSIVCELHVCSWPAEQQQQPPTADDVHLDRDINNKERKKKEGDLSSSSLLCGIRECVLLRDVKRLSTGIVRRLRMSDSNPLVMDAWNRFKHIRHVPIHYQVKFGMTHPPF